jgi:hypothetical protein
VGEGQGSKSTWGSKGQKGGGYTCGDTTTNTRAYLRLIWNLGVGQVLHLPEMLHIGVDAVPNLTQDGPLPGVVLGMAG